AARVALLQLSLRFRSQLQAGLPSEPPKGNELQRLSRTRSRPGWAKFDAAGRWNCGPRWRGFAPPIRCGPFGASVPRLFLDDPANLTLDLRSRPANLNTGFPGGGLALCAHCKTNCHGMVKSGGFPGRK